MTVEEKAGQIFGKMSAAIMDGGMSVRTGSIITRIKQASIVVCDEVIAVLSIKDPTPGATYSNPGKFFWQQVKKHIEDNY